ncbi:carbohydrate kinase family protein [Clostridium folliculivorans]|uniref:Fructokinase n=1 Tax=Clostridium folliculivorans TaxID=2886038 RepID=A0A9W5XYN4_9CLOT|nr:sugar kinase [Clostridium folliculivorans]GKU23451.1 fructokinase [Clostridium folliculivorans]GKU29568.1 fructokinase [Clostridium folliculivorans]
MFQFDNKINFINKKNDLLTVGELLVDMISADYGDELEVSSYNKFFGGSPANIAMNAKRLGINALVASAVGKDGLGNFLIKHIEKSGIDRSYIDTVDYSTSMVLVTKSKSSPIPIFYRAADYHLTYTNRLEEALKNSKIFHFSCWPISKEPSRSTIERCIVEAKKHGAIVSFDPNYHPMIWEKGEDGPEYIKSILDKVDIVKPSEDDAERLFGSDKPKNQIDKFLKLGAKLVVMTLGKDGAIASNGFETITFKTLATDVVDTTGAGDAFWSGFYASIIKGDTLREALNLGFAVSAYKLRYIGAVVELPTLEEIKEIYGL